MKEFREKFKPLDKIQIDVKYLTDIPNLLNGIIEKYVPKYQITARDYRSGLTFMGYTNHKDSTSIGIFTEYLISSLKSRGVDISNTHFQSDNGSEFRNITKKASKKSMYEEIIDRNNLNNIYNPPASPFLTVMLKAFMIELKRNFTILNSMNRSIYFFTRQMLT